jgi:hypothetical protein
VQDKKSNEINDLKMVCRAEFAAAQQTIVVEAAFYFCA